MIQSLDVVLWGTKVGTLVSYIGRYDEKACFYYDDTFLKSPYEIAPLQAPTSSPAARRGMPFYAEKDKIFCGLPSFIADSLPDHWGNKVFDRWAREQGIKKRHLTSLDRLAYIGRRGMGALEFMPSSVEEWEHPFRVEIDKLYALARATAEEADKFKIDKMSELVTESLFKVGTSAGGRRPKAVINMNLATGECYSGQTDAPEPGFTPLIIKFDEHSDVPYTRIEYAYYLMARAAGLGMMHSFVLGGEKSLHFLTERFDRGTGGKIHTQTLAAMNPSAASYEELFSTAMRVGVAPCNLRQLFLQAVLNVACGNVDDHNKNFSFMMGKDGKWCIAPSYDFTFAVDPSSPEYMNRHSMSICGKKDEITRKDLLALAAYANVRDASSVIDHAVGVARGFAEFASLAGLEGTWLRTIIDEISRRTELLAKG